MVFRNIDLFTDTDGTLLTAHTPSDGGAWSKLTHSGIYTGSIQSNRYRHLQASGAGGVGLHHLNLGQSDCSLFVDVESSHTEAVMDLILRYEDADNYWSASAYIGGNSLRILERTNGVVAVRASVAVTLAINTPYLLQFSAFGDLLVAKINGQSCAFTSTRKRTETRIGVGCTNSASNASVYFDSLRRLLGNFAYPTLWESLAACYHPPKDVTLLQARDQSGSNHGTLTGGVARVVSDGQIAYSFDGVNDSIQMPDNASLNPASALTVSVWIRPSDTSSTRSIVRKGFNTGVDLQYAMRMEGTQLRGIIVNSSGTTGAPAGGTLVANQWQHCAMRYDGANVTLYVNGVAVASAPLTGSVYSSTRNLEIGAVTSSVDASLQQLYAGRISDIRVYSAALTADEITDLASERGAAYIKYDTQLAVRR